jgi:hypothetical protein
MIEPKGWPFDPLRDEDILPLPCGEGDGGGGFPG